MTLTSNALTFSYHGGNTTTTMTAPVCSLPENFHETHELRVYRTHSTAWPYFLNSLLWFQSSRPVGSAVAAAPCRHAPWSSGLPAPAKPLLRPHGHFRIPAKCSQFSPAQGRVVNFFCEIFFLLLLFYKMFRFYKTV